MSAHAQEPHKVEHVQAEHADRATTVLSADPTTTAASTTSSWYGKLLSVPGKEWSLEWNLGWLYKISFLAVIVAYYPTYRAIRRNGLAIRPETWVTFGTVNAFGLAYGCASGNVPLIFTMTPATLWCGNIVLADRKEKALWKDLDTVVTLMKARYTPALSTGEKTPHCAPLVDHTNLPAAIDSVRQYLKGEILHVRETHEGQTRSKTSSLEYFFSSLVAGVIRNRADDAMIAALREYAHKLEHSDAEAWRPIDALVHAHLNLKPVQRPPLAGLSYESQGREQTARDSTDGVS